MAVLSVPGGGGTKPIWGEVAGTGSAGGAGGGAPAAVAWSLSMARMARSRARRVASRRYWSLEKEFGLQETDFPRGYFSGSRYMSSLWYRHAWVSALSRRRRVHSQRMRSST